MGASEMLQASLYLLYVITILCCLLLARASRDRPSVQLLCMPPIQFAIYALARRAYGELGGAEGAILLSDGFLVVFWVVLLLWPSWALFIARRQKRGRGFVALDGQRWVTERTRNGQLVAHPARQGGD